MPRAVPKPAELRRLYRAGFSQAAISARCGVAQSTISRRLRKLGVPRRALGRVPLVPPPWLRLVAAAGIHSAALAAAAGVSCATIQRWRRDYRLGRSPLGRPSRGRAFRSAMKLSGIPGVAPRTKGRWAALVRLGPDRRRR